MEVMSSLKRVRSIDCLTRESKTLDRQLEDVTLQKALSHRLWQEAKQDCVRLEQQYHRACQQQKQLVAQQQSQQRNLTFVRDTLQKWNQNADSKQLCIVSTCLDVVPEALRAEQKKKEEENQQQPTLELTFEDWSELATLTADPKIDMLRFHMEGVETSCSLDDFVLFEIQPMRVDDPSLESLSLWEHHDRWSITLLTK